MTVTKARPENASLPLLDTDTLRTFVAIAENGSFTRAAHQVFRTPSALSMQIKRLEETLGQSLFVREARRVSLTPEGEVLLGYGRRLLKLNEEAVGRFLAPSLEGSVRLGTPDDVGTRVLPQVLTRFARSHPAVQVNVNAGRSIDLLKRLDNGELDLALVTLGYSDFAYNSEHCAGQEAAMLADLAVAPFPASLVQPPLRVLGPESGLPALGDYQIALVRRDGAGPAAEALAEQVVQTFRERR